MLMLTLALTATADDSIWEKPITIQDEDSAGIVSVPMPTYSKPIIITSHETVRLVTDQEIRELVWALKSAIYQFRPVKELEVSGVGDFIIFDSIETWPKPDPNSPEMLRRKAKELEEQAQQEEQKIKDREKVFSILRKWEEVQKKLDK